MDIAASTEFKAKMEAMVGGYFVQEFTDVQWFYHIKSIDEVCDTSTGLCAKCQCALISIPKYTNDAYTASVDTMHIYKADVGDYKRITQEEFNEAAVKFNKEFNKELTNG